MFLVVTNIPGLFRTPDLRNYFSEYVEKEAFMCFHFRHRPQTQLAQLLDNALVSLPQPNSDSQTDSHKSDNPNGKNASLSRFQSLSASSSKAQQEELVEGSDTILNKSLEKQVTVDNTEKNNSEKALTLLDGSAKSANTKLHWLNSGLSGLSSLIKEKKGKAKADMKHYTQTLREEKSSICLDNVDASKHTLPKEHSNNEDMHSPIPESVVAGTAERDAGSNVKTCCILNIKDDFVDSFISKYNKKHWVDRAGDVLPPRCFVFRINFRKSINDDTDYRTRRELDSQSLSVDSPLDLIEFSPPPLMPQGNVGTPTQHFKTLIKTCQLPGSIIRKLGLEFPRSRGQKRFSKVPFNYGTGVVRTEPRCSDEEGITFTAAGHLIPSSADFVKIKNKLKKKQVSRRPKLELESEREDGAETEEWERYEAFHNDVTSQDRCKERLYEKEIELVWEKGGPGLVFYTDAQYWRQQEGDFDEQTTDEWDVDMSVYYERGAGDQDARDSVAMLHSDKLRSGKLSQSAFRTTGTHNVDKNRKKDTSSVRKKRRIGPTAPPVIGEFEEHTRGFGRRLLEAQGWNDGQGLGKDSKGLPYALDGDGQHPHDKKGFGYYGEKLEGWRRSHSSTGQRQSQQFKETHQQHKKEVLISTVFDRPKDVDPPTPTLRTHEPTTLSHRHNYVSFTKAMDPN